MQSKAMQASVSAESVGRMGVTLPDARTVRHLSGHASLDVRLADRWGCQVTTARARRDRCVGDVLAVMEECLAMGDTDRLGHLLTLFDAVLAGQPGLPRVDAIYQAARADVEEDLAECEYRRNPGPVTGKRWLDALGREGRANTPAMAAIRAEWSL